MLILRDFHEFKARMAKLTKTVGQIFLCLIIYIVNHFLQEIVTFYINGIKMSVRFCSEITKSHMDMTQIARIFPMISLDISDLFIRNCR